MARPVRKIGPSYSGYDDHVGPARWADAVPVLEMPPLSVARVDLASSVSGIERIYAVQIDLGPLLRRWVEERHAQGRIVVEVDPSYFYFLASVQEFVDQALDEDLKTPALYYSPEAGADLQLTIRAAVTPLPEGDDRVVAIARAVILCLPGLEQLVKAQARALVVKKVFDSVEDTPW